ncbi:MAG: hypothetical protein PHV82_15955, partial [Victivallaceae bacterium]|nr:hypothetical protein [Victivallaceae bacterium]
IAGKVEESRKSEPKILLVSQDNHYPKGFPIDEDEIYPEWAWEKATKKKGGQKALVVNGPLTGKIIFVSISDNYQSMQNDNETPEEEQQKKPSTLTERKERKNRQRQRHAITSLMEYIEAMEYEVPDRDTIFNLIACLGIDSIYRWASETHEGIAAYPTASGQDNLDTEVWKKLTDKIIYDLKQGQSGPIEARWIEAEIISLIIGFELQNAFKKAIEALPDPKAWKKLELQDQFLAESQKQAKSAA